MFVKKRRKPNALKKKKIILSLKYKTPSHAGGKLAYSKINPNFTIRVWSLTQREEVYYGIVHLQHGCALPVHHRQTWPPAHGVVGQAAGQDDEGLPGTQASQAHTCDFKPRCEENTPSRLVFGSPLKNSNVRTPPVAGWRGQLQLCCRSIRRTN